MQHNKPACIPMSPEEKAAWGGKRDNQTGRPALPEDIKRVHMTLRVAPETKSFLDKDKDGTGKAVDKLVVRAKLKKI